MSSRKIIEALNESDLLPSGVGDIVKYKGYLYHRGKVGAMGRTELYGIDTKVNRTIEDDGSIQFVKRDYEWGHEYYYGY